MNRPKLIAGEWASADETDPVFWYPSLATGKPIYCFYDETWTQVHGLYLDEAGCREALRQYAEKL